MNKTALMESQTKEKAAEKAMKRIREEKTRRKDEKSVDHVLKALDSLGTTEEKLGAICQKYAEIFNDHRLLQNAVKQAEKKNTVLQKEKEQLQAEHSKAILTRSRLENLCRELQRQNKAVKEECMLKMREEGEKKREVAAKFHSMLSEIGSLLAQNSDKNAKLRDDNLDMSMRLKSVCDQFEKKEQHVENLAKQMQLEMQLADAKLAKAKMEMDIEKETLQKEKQQLLIELAEYKRKVCEMTASELVLREQITMYSEKYEEFHKALLQSNSAIGDFKAEMERMTKHIRRLEKETATWKSRYDAAQRTLAEVTEAKIRADEARCLAERRLTALQGICRGLQDQCRQLRGEKKDDLVEDSFQKLEAQINETEVTSEELENINCSNIISYEKSKIIQPDVTNEDGCSVDTLPMLISEDISTLSSVTNISQNNELGNEFKSEGDVYDKIKLDERTCENIVENLSFLNIGATELQDNAKLNTGNKILDPTLLKSYNADDNNTLENGVQNNDIDKSCNSCSVLENIKELNQTYDIGNSNLNNTAINSSSIETSSEFEKTVPKYSPSENYVPVSSNGVEEIESKNLLISVNDDDVTGPQKDDSVIREDTNHINESNQNGETVCDGDEFQNSSLDCSETSEKILCFPEEMNQTKSKKKRKMKK